MLELRPNCEYCDKNLPPSATDACICSYECTFCSNCVQTKLKNVCPNCGGGFTTRPIRPQISHRPEVSLNDFPPSDCRINTQFTEQEIDQFVEKIENIPPEKR